MNSATPVFYDCEATGIGGLPIEIGWAFVAPSGEIESEGRAYVFASRVRSSTRTLDTTAGADLAVRVLDTIAPQASATRKNVLLRIGRAAAGR